MPLQLHFMLAVLCEQQFSSRGFNGDAELEEAMLVCSAFDKGPQQQEGFSNVDRRSAGRSFTRHTG